MAKYKSTEAKANNRAYIDAYNKANYDRLSLILPKGTKETIKKLAESHGYSMSQYVVNAIEWFDGVNLSDNKK